MLGLSLFYPFNHPIHNLAQWKIRDFTQRSWGETQFKVADIIRCCIDHGFLGDAHDNFRRAVEISQNLEFGKKIFRGVGIGLIYLN